MSNAVIKKSIHNAVIELMSTTELEKIMVVDIARKANVSRATLYRYYNSIDDIVSEVEDDFIEGVRDRCRYYVSSELDFDSLTQPQPIFVDIANYIYENKQLFLAMSAPNANLRFMNKWINIGREFYCGKIVYERFNIDSLNFYIEFAIAGLVSMIRYWLLERPEMSCESMASAGQLAMFGLLGQFQKIDWRGMASAGSKKARE